jgi:hypothetical protein
MKTLLLTSALAFSLSACVTIEVPHLVSDTAKAGRDAYDSVAARREAKKREKAATTLSHSYIGTRSQSPAEIKQQCEVEAAAKLRQAGGETQVAYTVVENEIANIGGAVAANCKLALVR